MDANCCKVFVRTDSFSNIIAVSSELFLEDTETWMEIDAGYGDVYIHAQGNYFDKPLFTEEGIAVYKLVDGKPKEKTEQELAIEREAIPTPKATQQEVINMALAELSIAQAQLQMEQAIAELSMTIGGMMNV